MTGLLKRAMLVTAGVAFGMALVVGAGCQNDASSRGFFAKRRIACTTL